MNQRDSQVSFSGSKQHRPQIFADDPQSHVAKPVFSKKYPDVPAQVQSKQQMSRQEQQVTPSPNPSMHFNAMFTFQADNTPRIQCHYHFDQIITLFCRHPSCYMPLCPNCVKIHSQEHQQQGSYGQFDTLENCLNEAYQKLSGYCNKFGEEMVQIQKFQGTTGDGLSEQLEKLKKAKQQAYTIVDNFFQTLEQELVIEIQRNHDFLKQQSNSFLKYLGQRQRQLSSFIERLATDKCVKNLLKYYCQNVEEDNDLYFKESQAFMKQLGKFTPHIIIDQPGMYQLSLDLARFVSLKKGQMIGHKHREFPAFDPEPEKSRFTHNPYASAAYPTSQIAYPPSQIAYPPPQSFAPPPHEPIITQTTDEKLHPYLRTPPKQPNYEARQSNSIQKQYQSRQY